MTIPRKLRRKTWIAATAMVAALLSLSVPASADQAGILEVEDVSGIANGTVFPTFNAPGTPLLDQFFFDYSGTDHHLKRLAALPQTPTIEISYSDNNEDDKYFYHVAHQRIVPSGISQGTVRNVCDRGACSIGIPPSAGGLIFVITGFRFSFDSGDHHIDSIGIIESGGQLTTWFADQNGDDDYTVNVDFAWVPQSRFATVSGISGVVDRAGSVGRTVATGEKVIRGFFVDNLNVGSSGDNHIKTFGVETNSNNITVFYGDKNPVDSADWFYRVDFAALI